MLACCLSIYVSVNFFKLIYTRTSHSCLSPPLCWGSKQGGQRCIKNGCKKAAEGGTEQPFGKVTDQGLWREQMDGQRLHQLEWHTDRHRGIQYWYSDRGKEGPRHSATTKIQPPSFSCKPARLNLFGLKLTHCEVGGPLNSWERSSDLFFWGCFAGMNSSAIWWSRQAGQGNG